MPKSGFAGLSGERRDAFMGAAIAEFAEKGYASANTNAIALSGGVSKGSVYNWFGSKRELYIYALAGSIERVCSGDAADADFISAGDAGDSAEALHDALNSFLMGRFVRMRRFAPEYAMVLSARRENSPEVAAEARELLSAADERRALAMTAALERSLEAIRLRRGVDARGAAEALRAYIEAVAEGCPPLPEDDEAVLAELSVRVDYFLFGVAKRGK